MPFPPQVPRPASRRGRDVAAQRIDGAAGRFNERILVLPRMVTPPLVTQSQNVLSLGGRFVRVLGMRGTLVDSTQVLQGVELANLRVRVLLNAESDLITGDTNFSSFGTLFGDPESPWYWFAAPARLRSGDKLAVTVNSTLALGEGTPIQTVEFAFLVQDDDVYQELYARELESLEYDAADRRPPGDERY
jgi:hypothetical protein